jgi:hypothetical protein
MFFIYRLGIIAAACAVAAIAGLSVALLATPHISPSSTRAAAVVAAPSAVPTAAIAARLQVPAAPPATRSVAPAPSSAPASTAIPVRSAAEILQQVRATVARMHSGRLEAVIDYGNGDSSVANVVFDLGDTQSKFDITTTYVGASGRQTARRTTINDRTWQRQADAAWVSQSAEESAAGQLQAFLPDFTTIKKSATLDDQEGLLALHWLGANGDDITLLIDPDTNFPYQLRQLARETGTLFTVTYQDLNAPVEIIPPN